MTKQLWVLKYLFIFISFFITCNSFAQPAIGKWRAHLSYNSVQHLTGSQEDIYAATDVGIQIYHRKSNNVETLHKVNGLSDVNISRIRYISQIDALIIGYFNGNLDMVQGSNVRNFSQLKNQSLYSDRAIYDILYNKDKVLIATGFGIVEFDPSEEQFKDTYFIVQEGGLKVNEMAKDGQYIYAATNQGIYFADNSGTLTNPGNWQRISSFENYMENFDNITLFGNKLIVNYDNPTGDDVLYSVDPVNGGEILLNNQGNIHDIKTGNSLLYVALGNAVQIINNSLQTSETIIKYPFGKTSPLTLFVDNQSSQLWIGDYNYGLVRRISTNQYESILRNGPERNKAFSMVSAGGVLYATRGGYSQDYTGENLEGMFYQFQKEKWNNVHSEKLNDFTDIAVDPNDPGHIFVGSWANGLLELKNRELVNQFNAGNSPLVSEDEKTKIAQLCTDRDGNLLMLNHGAESPLVMKRTNDEWIQFEYPELKNETIKKILWASNNFVWGCLDGSSTMFVVDFNETYDNPDDDRIRFMEPRDHNGKTYARRIYAIEEDNEDNIWFSTDEGTAVEYDPHNIFNDEIFKPNRIRITEEGYTQYLLRDNIVNEIYTDPANRKWFATEKSGVMLFSKDGERLVSHFTEYNSPLLTNKVQSLSMIKDNGEIFFGTPEGIVSYRTRTAESKEDFSEAYVFPNPVKPDYEGPITITGLVNEVNIKITDISGNLVYETVAEGGQAVWDGRTLNGKKVNTGVYLVFMTNEDGSKTHIEKILFIK